MSTGEVKPAASATFVAATMELTETGGYSQSNGIITGGATSARSTRFDTPGFSGSYSAGYRLADSVNAATFGAAQLAGDTTRLNGNGIVVFANIGAPVYDYLALYQQSVCTSSSLGTGCTTARYGGTGGWQHTVASGSSAQTRLDYFAYGTPTPLSAMPRSGVVKYTILGSGNFATDTDLWFLSSTTSVFVTVDFATGNISGNMLLAGQNFFKDQVGGIGGFSVRGSVTGNGATGSFADGGFNSTGTTPGQFRLMFVGPNADELVLTYVFDDGGHAGVGAAIGMVDPYHF